MKIGIYSGEAFPIYEIWNEDFESLSKIEVDENTLTRWRTVFEAFTAVQEEIIAKMEEQGQGHNVWAHGSWNGFKL